MDKPEYRVIIAGGRTFRDIDLLSSKCNGILLDKLNTHRITVLSGRAKGADQLGEEYARQNNLEIEYHTAEWSLYGKRAGLIRNDQMAENADALIAFWDGKSKGTEHIINCAHMNGLIVDIISY